MDSIPFNGAKDILNNYIQLKNLRKTPEREALLKLIYKKDEHFDADELHRDINKTDFNLSKATVYNSLELFVDSGVVIKHYLHNNISMYEKSFGQKQHDHFVCKKCHKVIEFCDPRLHQIISSLEEMLDVKSEHHNLYIYGTCNDEKCK